MRKKENRSEICDQEALEDPTRFARDALLAISREDPIDSVSDPEAWSIDLVTSLMHLCRKEQVDWIQVLGFASMHYADGCCESGVADWGPRESNLGVSQ